MTFSPRITISPLVPLGKLPAVFVQDAQVHGGNGRAGRADAVHPASGGVGRDDGRRFRKAVTLVHRDADGVEETLQLGVEQRSAADEELHPTAESLAHLPENRHVEEPDHGPQQHAPTASRTVAVAVIGIGRAEAGHGNIRSATAPFARMAVSMFRRKFLASAGTVIRK